MPKIVGINIKEKKTYFPLIRTERALSEIIKISHLSLSDLGRGRKNIQRVTTCWLFSQTKRFNELKVLPFCVHIRQSRLSKRRDKLKTRGLKVMMIQTTCRILSTISPREKTGNV